LAPLTKLGDAITELHEKSKVPDNHRGLEAFNAVTAFSKDPKEAIKSYMEHVKKGDKATKVKQIKKPLPASSPDEEAIEAYYKHKEFDAEDILDVNPLTANNRHAQIAQYQAMLNRAERLKGVHLIIKNKMVPQEEFNKGKKMCKTGSKVLNEAGGDKVEYEFSAHSVPNTVAAVQRHGSAKQSYSIESLRSFRRTMDRFFKKLERKL